MRSTSRAFSLAVLMTAPVLFATMLVVMSYAPLAQASAPQSRGIADASSIAYQMRVPDPASRYVEVEISVPTAVAASAKSMQLAMPAWAPGSYLVRDFGRHVYEVGASDLNGRALAVTREDKQTWTVKHGGRPFRFHYRVYANELSVRTSYVDDRVALLNGPSLLMYIVGQQARAASLRIEDLPAGWRIHTSMPRQGSTGPYLARNYDTLIDSPLLLGEAQTRRFDVMGTRFEYVLVAPSGTNADVDRLASDTEKIVRAFGDMMGGFPFPNYSFLALADGQGGGGLEHLRSTAFILRPFAFADEQGYISAAHLAAHEFFHAWNVKRMHDEVLGPFDYSKENYTDMLWFHEGFTETMEARALLRAGLIGPKDYLAGIAKSWTAYANRPGSDYTSIAELSRDAWIKSYQPAQNHREVTVSYYLKGDLIGLLLDLQLRERAAKHKKQGSLEGLFRRLWASAKVDPRTGEKMRPLKTRDIIAAASAEAGEPMDDFFARYVDGTQRLELLDALRSFGVAVDEAIPGFDPDKPEAELPAWAGLRAGEGATIGAIDPASPAARAGLAHGDEIIAVDQVRVRDVGQLNEHISDKRPGDRVRVTFARRGRLDRRYLSLVADPRREWTFVPSCDVRLDDAHKALRKDWLQVAAEPATTGATPTSDAPSELDCPPIADPTPDAK